MYDKFLPPTFLLVKTVSFHHYLLGAQASEGRNTMSFRSMSKGARAIKSTAEKAYQLFDTAPRIKIHELKDNKGARTTGRLSTKATNQAGHTQGALERAAKPPIGWIWGDFFRPWHRMFPGERKMNSDRRFAQRMIPISLLEVNRLIDLGWLDSTTLIDLPLLLATRKFIMNDVAGFMLTSEGSETLSAKIHIEVQYASQEAIAAVERAGGSIRVAYYDPVSIKCASNSRDWFSRGEVIPSRRPPPPSIVHMYADPSRRGYLAGNASIEKEREQLANTMGYEYCREEGRVDKDNKSVFLGIPAGSIVSLVDKKVFTPCHDSLKQFYGTL